MSADEIVARSIPEIFDVAMLDMNLDGDETNSVGG
jgi:hypothetical protein